MSWIKLGKDWKSLKVGDDLAGFCEKIWELRLFCFAKAAKDKFDVAHFVAKFGVVGAKTQTFELGGAKMLDNGTETVVPTTGAFLA